MAGNFSSYPRILQDPSMFLVAVAYYLKMNKSLPIGPQSS